MVRVAVVEDEPSCAQQLLGYLSRYQEAKGEDLEVTVFPNGLELVREYQPIWDIILLDIEMPEMDGMTAAQRVRGLDAEVVLLFTTNMAKYAIKGYEVDALDFMLKPVNYFVFSLRLDKAMLHARGRSRRSLMVPVEEGLRRISVGDICYVEVLKHKLYLHTRQGVFSTPGSLTEMEEQLSGEHFVRCNKGYLVNLRHITLVKPDSVLVDGDELLISRRRREEFLLAVTDYYGGGGR